MGNAKALGGRRLPAVAPVPAPTVYGSRPGFVHLDRAAAKVPAVEGCNGRSGLRIRAHLDESKAFALARTPISDYVHTIHGTVLGKQLFKV